MRDPAMQAMMKKVEIETVEKRVISPTILASGNLTYQTEIRMVSEVMGRVQEIRVKEGDAVKRGDVLLRLDPATDRLVATIDLGRDVESVVETPDGYIWVAGGGPQAGGCNPAAGYLAVIDPSTNRVVRTGHIACPVSLLAHDREIWVGTDGPNGPSFVLIDPRR